MKLGQIQYIADTLNPILEGKCGALLALDILGVINEIQPELEKINTVKQKMVEDYALKDEEGNYINIKLENGQEGYEFGDNSEKVNDEMFKLMNSEVDISSKIDISNFDNDVKIEPLRLKYLHDLEVLKK
jgi:hypothetical protein